MGQFDLHEIVPALHVKFNENVLASFENFEDAGVYKLSDEIAIVQSIDVITPVVDDPIIYGQITAANAMSDIYAMGAVPVTALNFAGIPRCDFGDELLVLIQEGALNKLEEAGCTLIGGHTVDDKELKFGLCITGTVHPEKVIYNSRARVGDDMILTKPIGSGTITTAYKKGVADEADVSASIKNMTTLNKTACEIMTKYDVSACTDVTGFGLMGHLYEIAAASGVTALLEYDTIPLLNGAYGYASKGLIPGGARKNEKYLSEHIAFERERNDTEAALLCDPQTSGGLLICVDKNNSKNLLKELQDNSIINAQIVGRILEKGEKPIVVV